MQAKWEEGSRRSLFPCLHKHVFPVRCILTHFSQKVEQAVSKDFPRKKRNLSTFKNTVSLFKRGVNFPLHPTWKPTWVKRSEVFSFSRCLSSRLPREFVISSNVMRWWQISNTLPHQQAQNATTVEEDAAPIGPENKTKQKRRRSQEAGYPFHAPRLFACHLLHMIITTERGIGG